MYVCCIAGSRGMLLFFRLDHNIYSIIGSLSFMFSELAHWTHTVGTFPRAVGSLAASARKPSQSVSATSLLALKLPRRAGMATIMPTLPRRQSIISRISYLRFFAYEKHASLCDE